MLKYLPRGHAMCLLTYGSTPQRPVEVVMSPERVARPRHAPERLWVRRDGTLSPEPESSPRKDPPVWRDTAPPIGLAGDGSRPVFDDEDVLEE